MTDPMAIAPIMPPCPALPVDLRSIVQKSSVAIAMPETGLLLEPTSPTSREETVAKKNPNTAMHTAPSSVTGMGREEPDKDDGDKHERADDPHRQVAVGAQARCPFRRRSP